jgi:hypothetical protein
MHLRSKMAPLPALRLGKIAVLRRSSGGPTRYGILAATIATLVIGLTCLALTPRHDGALSRGFPSPVLAAERARHAGS